MRIDKQVACLFICGCLALGGTPVFADSPVSNQRQNSGERKEEAVEWLLKHKYYFLVDNQVTHWTFNRRDRHIPGIALMWTWPSGQPDFKAIGEVAGELQLWRGDQQLTIELDENNSTWHPHALHTEYIVEGGRLKQDQCIDDDTVVCELTLEGVSDVQIRVVGSAASGEGCEELAIRDGAVVLKNLGSLSGVWQAIASSGTPSLLETPAKRYQFQFSPQGRIVLAGTLSRDRDRALARVKKALDHPDDAFKHAKSRWDRFFSAQVPRFECSDSTLVELYYWIAYVLEANAYRDLHDPNWPYSYVVPSKWEWRGIWPEDLSHCLTGLRWFNDPSLANDCLRMIHHRYVPDRTKHLITHSQDELDFKTASRDVKVHAYGFTTMAAWEVFLKTGDDDLLRELLPRMCKMNRFEAEVRDDDKDGLTAMFDSFHLGGDASPRFDFGGGNYTDSGHRYFKRAIEPIDANSYYLRQSQILARIATKYGDENIAGEMSQRASKTKAAIERYMWNEQTGLYYDVFGDDNQRSTIKTVAGMFPLFADVATRAQATRVVKHLLDPKEFWGAYPIPWLAGDEPAVKKAGGWTGNISTAVDIRNNWLVVEGLVQYGFDDAAREVIWRTMKLLNLKGPHLVETAYYYDPATGKSPGNSLNVIFSTPVAGVFDFFLRRMVGVDPMEGDLVRFHPLALDTHLAYLNVTGLQYKGHEIAVRWSGAPEPKYRAFIDGQQVLETSDPTLTNVVYDLVAQREVDPPKDLTHE